jgi:hypothetical protein
VGPVTALQSGPVLVGRADELAQLDSWLDEPGGAGSVWLVTGLRARRAGAGQPSRNDASIFAVIGRPSRQSDSVLPESW